MRLRLCLSDVLSHDRMSVFKRGLWIFSESACITLTILVSLYVPDVFTNVSGADSESHHTVDAKQASGSTHRFLFFHINSCSFGRTDSRANPNSNPDSVPALI